MAMIAPQNIDYRYKARRALERARHELNSARCGSTKSKHDGYRLMVRRDGAGVRCFTRNGHDWADRFPAIVEAAEPNPWHRRLLIDGEAVIAHDDEDVGFSRAAEG